MKRLFLAVVAAALTGAPVSAGVVGYAFGPPDGCGGTSFEVCISGSVWASGNSIFVDVTNLGPGVITGVGLWGLPSGTILPTGAVVYSSTDISQADWNLGGSNDISGVVGDNALKYAIGTLNGINGGLAVNGQATFRFDFATDIYPAQWSQLPGVGVHAQGVGSCSSKLFLYSPGGDAANGGEYDETCVSVPEPGSMALLATGAMGMAFIARRRRKGAELVDEDGHGVDA